MKKMPSNYFMTCRVEDAMAHVSAMAYTGGRYYGDERFIKVMFASFYTKQIYEAFLAGVNRKDNSFYYGGSRYVFSKGKYLANSSACTDINEGDGYHCVLFADEDNTIIVPKGAEANTIVFNRLSAKFNTGMLPEWKNYIIGRLIDEQKIKACGFFDRTEEKLLPSVYLLDDVSADYLREIKKEGLQSGAITLDVQGDYPLSKETTFMDLLSYVIDEQKNNKCMYNVGDEINPVISSDILKEGRTTKLFPKQQIMAQGIYNLAKYKLETKEKNKTLALKERVDCDNGVFFNGGPGVGKTYTTIKAVIGVIMNLKDKKDNFRVGVYCQKHIIKNWVREFKMASYFLGIKPTVKVVNNHRDVLKLNKKPIGQEILVFSKDSTKMNYVVEHNVLPRHSTIDYINSAVEDFVLSAKVNSKIPLDFIDATNIKQSSIKIAMDKFTCYKNRLVLMYRKMEVGEECYYFCNTNSKCLLEVATKNIKTKNKAYDFKVKGDAGINMVKKLIMKLKTDIENENIVPRKFKSEIIEGAQCPHCGGRVYDSYKNAFD